MSRHFWEASHQQMASPKSVTRAETLTQTCKQLPSTTDHHFLPDLQTTDAHATKVSISCLKIRQKMISCHAKKNPVFGVCIVTDLNSIRVVTMLSSNHMPHPMRPA